MVGDLVLGDAMCDFGVEASARADYRDVGIGVEEVEDAAGCYLWGCGLLVILCCQMLGRGCGGL